MNPLDYFVEQGGDIIQTDQGWANFFILGKECYIENIYVAPGARGKGEASKIADMIASKARSEGCTYLIGSTNTQKPGVERSMLSLLHYGFKYLSSSPTAIFYKKEL